MQVAEPVSLNPLKDQVSYTCALEPIIHRKAKVNGARCLKESG